MDFCDKLVYIMGELQLTSAGLARKIPVDPALVSRWRTGRRIPKDGDTITRITTAVLESARTEQEKALLHTLISNYEEEGLSTAEKISRWFFDGSGIQTPPVMRPSQPAGVCLPGMEGFFTAVSMLEYAARQRVRPPELTAYVSTEQLNLLLDERTGTVWERLYLLTQAPVPVILGQNLDAERLSKVLSVLLPYIQAGRILLHHIPSVQRQFCYDFTILAKGIGMVMAMEPPGIQDASISMFIDHLSFVGGVGAKLAEFHDKAKPMLRLLRDSADERSFLKQCFQDNGPVYARFDAVNLLYADPSGYKELLMANGVPYESRRWRISEFSAMRKAFERFLEAGQYRELLPLTAIDGLTDATHATPPDLRFLQKETVVYPSVFVESLLKGMINFLERFSTLEIMLTRSNPDTGVVRMKEDTLLLLQNASGGQTISITSDNWLVVNAYIQAFHDRWNAGEDIFGKNNVIYTIKRLLQKSEAISASIVKEVSR